jgi:hypothetical protein
MRRGECSIRTHLKRCSVMTKESFCLLQTCMVLDWGGGCGVVNFNCSTGRRGLNHSRGTRGRWSTRTYPWRTLRIDQLKNCQVCHSVAKRPNEADRPCPSAMLLLSLQRNCSSRLHFLVAAVAAQRRRGQQQGRMRGLGSGRILFVPLTIGSLASLWARRRQRATGAAELIEQEASMQALYLGFRRVQPALTCALTKHQQLANTLLRSPGRLRELRRCRAGDHSAMGALSLAQS